MRHGYPPSFSTTLRSALGTDGKVYDRKGKFNIFSFVLSWLPWFPWGPKPKYQWTLKNKQLSDHEMMKCLLEHLNEYEHNNDIERLKSVVTGDNGDMVTSEMNAIFGGIQYFDIYKMYMTLRIIAHYFGRENVLKLTGIQGQQQPDELEPLDTNALLKVSKYLLTERSEENKHVIDTILTPSELWKYYMLEGWAGNDMWFILGKMQYILYPNMVLQKNPKCKQATSVREVLYKPTENHESLNDLVRDTSNSYGIILYLLWSHKIYDETSDDLQKVFHG